MRRIYDAAVVVILAVMAAFVSCRVWVDSPSRRGRAAGAGYSAGEACSRSGQACACLQSRAPLPVWQPPATADDRKPAKRQGARSPLPERATARAGSAGESGWSKEPRAKSAGY